MYLVTWIGCLVFFICYREWFSFISLALVTALPWFSLLVSLPAVLTARAQKQIPAAVSKGTSVPLGITVKSPFPMPVWRVKVRVERLLTGEYWRMRAEYLLPTDHCGRLVCRCGRVWVYDYLGLFRFPLKRIRDFSVSVRPVARQSLAEDGHSPAQTIAWKAKRGGGFAENHELRLYRPGDSIRAIHWKASGKTGKLILREPMEPNTPPVLALSLCGSKDVLDSKLGRLLYLGESYLQQSIRFRIYAYTGRGLVKHEVAMESDLLQAIDDILGCPPSDGEAVLPLGLRARYIGGDAL